MPTVEERDAAGGRGRSTLRAARRRADHGGGEKCGLDPSAPSFTLAPNACNFAAIRDEHYRYVHFAGLSPVLHDLKADPGEVRNNAGDPASKAIVAEYAARLLDWRMTTGEPVLV